MHQRKARFLLALLFVAASARNTAVARQPTTVPLTIVHGYPNFSADIDGHKVRLLFDSQGDSTLALTKATLDELGIKATEPSHRAMDFRGNTLEAPSFQVKRLRIGNAVFRNVHGNVELHASYVAPPLLARYRIVLDYQARKMTLIPPWSPAHRAGWLQWDRRAKLEWHCEGADGFWRSEIAVGYSSTSLVHPQDAYRGNPGQDRQSSCTYKALPRERQ